MSPHQLSYSATVCFSSPFEPVFGRSRPLYPEIRFRNLNPFPGYVVISYSDRVMWTTGTAHSIQGPAKGRSKLAGGCADQSSDYRHLLVPNWALYSSQARLPQVATSGDTKPPAAPVRCSLPDRPEAPYILPSSHTSSYGVNSRPTCSLHVIPLTICCNTVYQFASSAGHIWP